MLAAFFAALVAFVQNEQIAVFSTSQGPRALSKVVTNKKQIALTFDVGWGDVRFEPIMDYLTKQKIKATFFVTGEWADRHHEWIEDLKKQGYEIGSHGMQHESYTKMDEKDIRKDMLLANRSLDKAGIDHLRYIRPPDGQINDRVLKIATKMNQQVILWSVDPQDWTNPGYEKIAKDVVDHAQKGDIIRLHASDSAKQTIRALPIIVRELQDQGYTFVTLSTLISNAKVKTNLIH